jgi:hypothetical protein
LHFLAAFAPGPGISDADGLRHRVGHSSVAIVFPV